MNSEVSSFASPRQNQSVVSGRVAHAYKSFTLHIPHHFCGFPLGNSSPPLESRAGFAIQRIARNLLEFRISRACIFKIDNIESCQPTTISETLVSKMTMQNHVLNPDELAMAQRVYNDIISQDWFDRTDENEEACAIDVLHFFHQGMIVESILARICKSAAKEKFRKPV
jgi:hypothetical protein